MRLWTVDEHILIAFENLMLMNVLILMCPVVLSHVGFFFERTGPPDAYHRHLQGDLFPNKASNQNLEMSLHNSWGVQTCKHEINFFPSRKSVLCINCWAPENNKIDARPSTCDWNASRGRCWCSVCVYIYGLCLFYAYLCVLWLCMSLRILYLGVYALQVHVLLSLHDFMLSHGFRAV